MDYPNVIVMGNATDVRNREYGHLIDKFDIIIRIGYEYNIEGFEKYVGSRTDITTHRDGLDISKYREVWGKKTKSGETSGLRLRNSNFKVMPHNVKKRIKVHLNKNKLRVKELSTLKPLKLLSKQDMKRVHYLHNRHKKSKEFIAQNIHHYPLNYLKGWSGGFCVIMYALTRWPKITIYGFTFERNWFFRTGNEERRKMTPKYKSPHDFAKEKMHITKLIKAGRVTELHPYCVK